jgi:hypothetical protein
METFNEDDADCPKRCSSTSKKVESILSRYIPTEYIADLRVMNNFSEEMAFSFSEIMETRKTFGKGKFQHQQQLVCSESTPRVRSASPINMMLKGVVGVNGTSVEENFCFILEFS